MSCCPTDRPVSKSILWGYRPTADGPLSLSRFYHCPSSPICFFFTCHLSSPSLSLSVMLISSPLLCRSHSPSPSLPLLSLICSSIFALSVRPHKSQSALYHSLFLPLLFFFCPTHSLLLLLFQAANGEQNHHD